MVVITTRLEKNDDVFRIEIPKEYVTKLDWRKGQILSLDVSDEKLMVEKMHGFVGA